MMCALEFAPGFTVNGVAPGLILPPPGKDENYLDGLAKTSPSGNTGDRGHRGRGLYLLKSDFVTGQILYVDGGRHLGEEQHGRILISDLLVRCIIGVRDEERRDKQDVLINVALSVDLRKAGASDGSKIPLITGTEQADPAHGGKLAVQAR